MKETLDGHYVIGHVYEEIGVLVDLCTCLKGSSGHNKICESECGCVQLFGSLRNRPLCGYNEIGNKHAFEEL